MSRSTVASWFTTSLNGWDSTPSGTMGTPPTSTGLRLIWTTQ